MGSALSYYIYISYMANSKNGILTKFLMRSAMGYTYVSPIDFLRPIIVDVFIANKFQIHYQVHFFSLLLDNLDDIWIHIIIKVRLLGYLLKCRKFKLIVSLINSPS